MYEKSLEKPYSRELFSIQDTVQDMCEYVRIMQGNVDGYYDK